jgi:hypothetical protein
MPIYSLGNGDDNFDSADIADWTNDSVVLGGNGDDDIIARDLGPAASARLVVAGGNGRDTIHLNALNSFAFGDNGADTLVSTGGEGNTLDGGNGRDVLISLGAISGMFEHTTLTGGRGDDNFELFNLGNLVVTDDADDAGVVSEGDAFFGPMDVITDYQRGEFIGLLAFDRVEEVPLTPDPLSPADRFRPVLGDGEHAIIRGAYGGDGRFTAGASGGDLLVIYDVFNGEDNAIAQGSLVLLGFSNADAVTIG